VLGLCFFVSVKTFDWLIECLRSPQLCLFCLFFLYISHIIQLTPQELSAEPKNSASAEALAVARRPEDASREKTRPPPVSRDSSPWKVLEEKHHQSVHFVMIWSANDWCLRSPTLYLFCFVRTQQTSCSSDSRFRRKLSGTTGHRLLGTQRPQMLCVAAWVCLSTECVGLFSGWPCGGAGMWLLLARVWLCEDLWLIDWVPMITPASSVLLFL